MATFLFCAMFSPFVLLGFIFFAHYLLYKRSKFRPKGHFYDELYKIASDRKVDNLCRPLPKFGRCSLQDSSQTAVDVLAMFETITAYNTMVTHPDQLYSMLVSAISCALSESRPVHLSIPSDVMRSTIEPRQLKLPKVFKTFDPHTVSILCDRVLDAKRIAICIGENVKAPDQLYRFIARTNSSFVCTPVGKAYANEHHPKYRGVIGFAGHDSATSLLADPDVDLIIAVGTTFDELSTGGWTNGLTSSKVFHIDDRLDAFTRSENACHVFGTIDSVLTELVKIVESSEKVWTNSSVDTLHLKDVIRCHHDCEPVRPQYLMRTLSELSKDVRFYIDAGNSWAWATHYLLRDDVIGNYRIGMGFGSMGWSIGASIGAAIASRKPTVCVVGDGSYLMSAQEITVAVQLKLPIVFVVLNDSALGMVYHGQRLGNQESIGWELPTINFAMMAQSVGARSLVVNSSKELDAICIETLFVDGPVLIDVRIDRDEVPPMGDRVKGLSKSVTPGA